MAAMPGISSANSRSAAIQHIVRYGDGPQIDRLLALVIPAEPAEDCRPELADLRAVHQSYKERGDPLAPEVTQWASQLAGRLLRESLPQEVGWTSIAHGPGTHAGSAFGTQSRPFADGQQGALLHSSFPKGETATGILRSDNFDLPAKLSFFIAGHNGFPRQPETPNNLVRLCDAATGQVLREALPPRNDTAQRVEWDLSDCRGRRGYVEIVDGDDRTSYAWLAAGRFSIEGLNPGGELPRAAACELVADLKLTELQPRMAELARDSATPASLRSAAAGALLALRPDARLAVLREAAASTTLPAALCERCYTAIAHSTPVDSSAQYAQDLATLLKQVLQTVPAQTQRQLATLLAGDADGAGALLDLVQQGAASPRLLQDAALVVQLRAQNLPDLDARLAALTADLPDFDAALATLLAERREQYHRAARSLKATGSEARGAEGASGPRDAARGQALFRQHCAACHQIGGEGAKIGPQLDGIGIRGPDRLLEDILDPHRNVDAAFRTTILVLRDGQVRTGLVRREEGATLVLADQQGKEFAVPASDIELRKDSPLSLMPSQMAEKLPADDLTSLVQFLLQQHPAR
jgi:putative heme-binding domain-containing protein